MSTVLLIVYNVYYVYDVYIASIVSFTKKLQKATHIVKSREADFKLSSATAFTPHMCVKLMIEMLKIYYGSGC